MANRSVKSKKQIKKRDQELHEQGNREILGVIFIAIGLFIAATMYTDAVGIIGRHIADFCFGMFGIVGYGIPVLLFVCGVVAIAMSKTSFPPSTFFLLFIGIVCLLVVIHTYVRNNLEGVKLFSYYADAYTYGELYGKGGGVLGALLAYPSILLIGAVGTYIFFSAAILIVFLLITRMSIRAVGEMVGKTIMAGVDTVTERVSNRQLYIDSMENMPKPKRTSRRKPAHTIKISRQEEDKAPSYLDELNLLPNSGILSKKAKNEDDPFDLLANVSETHRSGDTGIPQNFDKVSHISDKAAIKSAPVPAVVPEQSSESTRIFEYQRPPYSLLKSPSRKRPSGSESPAERSRLLIETLASFNINAKVINYSVGPVITRFELQPAQGVRVNRITTLSDDIALALAAPRVRIEAPIPGKSAIGIEIPNRETAPVLLREVIESSLFVSSKSPLSFALGKDITGNVVCADLDKMPHLLIAGSTGSGKSVCINDIILSFVYHTDPHQLHMILIDPKKVELKVYGALPHLHTPVVTDAKKAAGVLKWAVMEMEQRYQKMSQFNARDLSRYNSLQADPADILPRLVIIIDELADLIMVAAKEVEDSICRIAQLGRACGIHLIVATQRPSADIITGLIKANIPSRIALAVSSSVDSRVILDCSGAEKLLGRGDMLFHANGASKPIRAQAAFVSDEEVERVTAFIARQNTSDQANRPEVTLEEIAVSTTTAQGNGKQEDDLLPDAVKIVLESGQASISMIQRRLRVGYARAARLIDIMEQMKIVSGFDGSKPRKLLIGPAEYERMFGDSSGGEVD